MVIMFAVNILIQYKLIELLFIDNNNCLRKFRYDARGYLNDLSQYDTRKPTNSLNTEEIEFEQQLNEERFADLIYDEISKTPEAVSSGEYSKVGYQYDQPEVKSISKDANNAELESKGNSFKVPPGLTIPSNIILVCLLASSITK